MALNVRVSVLLIVGIKLFTLIYTRGISINSILKRVMMCGTLRRTLSLLIALIYVTTND